MKNIAVLALDVTKQETSFYKGNFLSATGFDPGVPVKCETKQKRNGTKRNRSKRNETNRNETKQIETKRNKSKRNETDRNETKQIETKRNKSKRNETNCMERNIDIYSIN